MMVKNKYPLSLISELISQLHRAKYFTKLDIHWGFNNVCIKPRNEWKAAFWTNRDMFEPLVMFFGNQQSSHLPNHDERHLPRPYSGRHYGGLSGRHPNLH